jgi:hypothetical protein
LETSKEVSKNFCFFEKSCLTNGKRFDIISERFRQGAQKHVKKAGKNVEKSEKSS